MNRTYLITKATDSNTLSFSGVFQKKNINKVIIEDGAKLNKGTFYLISFERYHINENILYISSITFQVL